MPNAIELITKYSTKAWDKVYKAEAISSLLDAPSGMIKFDEAFEGAKTVKIARFESGGLSDYYRANTPVDGNFQHGYGTTGDGRGFGYQMSSLAVKWETFEMRVDRAARFHIEKFDDEETDGLAVGMATSEVSRTIMIPEIDAYAFVEIAKHTSTTKGNRKDGAISNDGTKPLEALNEALLYFDNHEVPADNQIIFVSPTYLNALRNSNEIYKTLSQADYDKNVKFKLTEYEGRRLAVVPPQRFNTTISLDQGGYRVGVKDAVTGEVGKPIDFLVVAKDAVTHVVKYNKVKVISGDLNLASQNFDGFTIFARVYHDLFVPQNKEYAIYCHTGGFTYEGAAAGKATIEVAHNKGTLTKLSVFPGNLFVKYYKTATQPTVGSKPASGATEVIVGSTIANNDYVYAVDQSGLVIAVSVKQTVASA